MFGPTNVCYTYPPPERLSDGRYFHGGRAGAGRSLTANLFAILLSLELSACLNIGGYLA